MSDCLEVPGIRGIRGGSEIALAVLASSALKRALGSMIQRVLVGEAGSE
jgi:hypothetical protein